MVRPGQPDDAAEFARLVLISDEAFLPFLFGDRLETVLRRMFSVPRNLFSYEHVTIVEAEGRVAGMLLGYSYEQMRREVVRTGLLFLRHMGFFLLRQIPVMLRAIPRSRREERSASWLAKREFYISNVAVKPAFRNLGLGHVLLADAAERAREVGCCRIVLDMEAENQAALRFYEREGFVKEASNLLVMGRFEFLRLSRELTTD
jgi:ribosomal protein S18 acetylase RimI-like enzyme